MKKTVTSTRSNSVTSRSNSVNPELDEDDEDINFKFRRTNVIGRGKFGVVYKGYHLNTKHVYAIKVLNLDSDEDEVEDVQKEIQFLASLKQLPNITRYYGSYLKNTSLWIIMEYCGGGSLRSLLRPGKIDEKYIGVIMREILIALKYIHKDNVIHRDIKAANVLINNDGSIKLCDFGVAAQLNQTKSRRQTMAGTPYWMAPEVIMEGVYYDTKADIWSTGITAYEVTTGNPPYCDVEALRAMQLIAKSKPPRLEGRNYSALIKEFIATCLDEDPSERPTADELLKTAFIKTYKPLPTSILKELISRYLLFRDKTKRESVAVVAEEEHEKAKLQNNFNNDIKGEVQATESNDAEANEMKENFDTKWDFDSLSSTDYIIENNINIDAIPEENNDWINDDYNYAYPDEDHYPYYHTNNIGKTIFQGSTIGKNAAGGTYIHNSTLNAVMTQQHSIINTAATGNNTTNNITMSASNYHSKVMQATNNGLVGTNVNTKTGTYTTGRKTVDAKAPKALLDLFEDNDVINEEDEELINQELPRMNNNLHTTSLSDDISATTAVAAASDVTSPVAHPGILTSNAYYSQSSPALPVLQTKFSKSSKIPAGPMTAIPTSIEIEIPEELPNSSMTTPSNTSNTNNINITGNSSTDLNLLHTKPRSATLSSSPLAYKQPLQVNRRPAISGSGSNSTNSVVPEETSRSVSGTGLPTSGSKVNMISNHKTPSPSQLLNKAGTNVSPIRKPTVSPIVTSSMTSTVPVAMKPVNSSSNTDSEVKDILLQPLNNNASSILNDKETSRVSGDFRRNNPNLKLQMPLPTTALRTKLLDGATNYVSAMANAADEKINQFGINTSTAQNIPVSMTPIGDKHMDFGLHARVKRSHSTVNRKSSFSAGEYPGSTVSTITTVTSNAATASTTMARPPTVLKMDMFQDVDLNSTGNRGHITVDRKPYMLTELDKLLKMFEDGLPAIESILKKQLASDTSSTTAAATAPAQTVTAATAPALSTSATATTIPEDHRQ
ncbi:hypothetical protein KAFR_0D04950 [Kazachstania africana CBS 2517]|uniref:non-specific serine/threonine protein kinase n=1 Tax=Kazachstania africana (strain ATCC 22294 / BCRC 22015 / CBS 2517 / CECT 1963 / NBRC 1671 / NRRL Y-8276) TaxID=1071382 RepID=H2AUU2_KAZAF|nr:hypothetical protein KAFR_0D04950 [Kazachstania africana CBS 2517]CCF58142.1 hypothetical protein KAFR_0D04950 [Kazachstania africana CBS 2517]